MAAAGCAATAFVSLFHCFGLAFIDDQAIVVIEFLTALDIPQGVDIDTFFLFARFAVGFACMIDPACIAAVHTAIYHLAVFEAEEKRVVRIFRIGAMAFGSLFFRDALTLVFDHEGIGWNIARRKNAATVDSGIPDDENRFV